MYYLKRFCLYLNITFSVFMDIMLFAISFVVVIVAVGLLKAPSQTRKFPHTANLLICVSDLFGWISHTILPYVTFSVAKGTSLLGMNVQVFVPFILFSTP